MLHTFFSEVLAVIIAIILATPLATLFQEYLSNKFGWFKVYKANQATLDYLQKLNDLLTKQRKRGYKKRLKKAKQIIQEVAAEVGETNNV